MALIKCKECKKEVRTKLRHARIVELKSQQ